MFGKKLRFKCLCLAAAHTNSSEDIVDVADSYYKFCVNGEVAEKNSPLGKTNGIVSGKNNEAPFLFKRSDPTPPVDEASLDAPDSASDQDEPTPPLSCESSPSNLTGGTADPNQVNN